MRFKKGLSHIEFVLSFVIFVGFLIFAFVFLNPLQSNRTMKSSLDYSWIEVSQETMDEMETYSVFIPGYSGQSVSLNIINEIGSVENSSGAVISYYNDPSKYIHFTVPHDEFVRIKYSSRFDNGGTISGSTQLSSDVYTISSSQKDKVYFENLFIDLKGIYLSNYPQLKTDFNLPSRVEFGFVVRGPNINVTAINNIPEDMEVLSKTDKIMVLNKTGTASYADMRVMVW